MPDDAGIEQSYEEESDEDEETQSGDEIEGGYDHKPNILVPLDQMSRLDISKV